ERVDRPVLRRRLTWGFSGCTTSSRWLSSYQRAATLKVRRSPSGRRITAALTGPNAHVDPGHDTVPEGRRKALEETGLLVAKSRRPPRLVDHDEQTLPIQGDGFRVRGGVGS